MNKRKCILARNGIRCTLLVLCLCFAGGCSDPEAENRQVYEEYMDAQLENKAKLAELLTTIRDEKSMDQAYSKLYDLNRTEESLVKRALTLPVLSNETLLHLQDKLKQLAALKEQIRKEARRISQLPGGENFLKDLSPEHRGQGNTSVSDPLKIP